MRTPLSSMFAEFMEAFETVTLDYFEYKPKKLGFIIVASC